MVLVSGINFEILGVKGLTEGGNLKWGTYRGLSVFYD